MDLLREVFREGGDPGKYLANELKEAILPVTDRIDSLETKIESIQGSLETIESFIKLVQPVVITLRKLPFFSSKK